MITRTLEPEVMDNAENAQAYAAADFSTVNQEFIDRFLEIFPEFRDRAGKALDLGCGPADIPIRLAKAAPKLTISAVDASDKMLEHARRALAKSKDAARIQLVHGRIPELMLVPSSFDAVISNSLLHHIPEPAVFWKTVRYFAAPGARIYVMDLFRPESQIKAREIVETNAGDEHPVLKEDFYNSLLAAFTLEEVRAQLAAAGLSKLKSEYISDRHWLVSGQI